MAKFEENIFKPEEEQQGYITGEGDADVFMLGDDDEYPGMVPDFWAVPDPIEVEPEAVLNIDDREEAVDDSVTEDIIEDFVPEPAIDEIVEEPDIADTFEDAVEDSAIIDEVEEPDVNQGLDFGEEDTLEDEEEIDEDANLDMSIDIEDEDLNDVWSAFGAPDFFDEEEESVVSNIAEPEPAPEPIPEPAPEPEITQEEMADLSEFIAAQKEKVEPIKSTPEPEEEFVFEPKPEPQEDAEPVFAEITGEYEEPRREPEPAPEPKQDSIPEPEPKEEPKRYTSSNTNKEKRKGGILGWLVAAVLFIILSGFIISVYLTDNNDSLVALVNDILGKTEKVADSTDVVTDEIMNSEDSLFTEVPVESTEEEELTDNSVEEAAGEETSDTISEEVYNEPQPESKYKPRKSPSKKDYSDLTKEKRGQNGVIKRVYEPSEKQAENYKENKKSKDAFIKKTAKEKMVVKSDDIAENKQKSKAVSTEQIEKPIMPSLDTHKGTFSVQVYSTISKKDANDRMRTLKAKNLKNVYISEYQKRDVLWYRVRFGEFGSYEEAMQEAQKHGFSDAWVDRIK
jgi:hypothetical protein